MGYSHGSRAMCHAIRNFVTVPHGSHNLHNTYEVTDVIVSDFII